MRSSDPLISNATETARERPEETPPLNTASNTSAVISQRIADIGDWRGPALARMRGLIREADPEVLEELKWVKPSNPGGVPVWYHDGIICTGEAYKAAVKLTFAKGASLPDPAGLFNASLEGSARRAIDIREGEEVDPEAFKALVREAVALNTAAATAKARGRKR